MLITSSQLSYCQTMLLFYAYLCKVCSVEIPLVPTHLVSCHCPQRMMSTLSAGTRSLLLPGQPHPSCEPTPRMCLSASLGAPGHNRGPSEESRVCGVFQRQQDSAWMRTCCPLLLRPSVRLLLRAARRWGCNVSVYCCQSNMCMCVCLLLSE